MGGSGTGCVVRLQLPRPMPVGVGVRVERSGQAHRWNVGVCQELREASASGDPAGRSLCSLVPPSGGSVVRVNHSPRTSSWLSAQSKHRSNGSVHTTHVFTFPTMLDKLTTLGRDLFPRFSLISCFLLFLNKRFICRVRGKIIAISNNKIDECERWDRQVCREGGICWREYIDR